GMRRMCGGAAGARGHRAATTATRARDIDLDLWNRRVDLDLGDGGSIARRFDNALGRRIGDRDLLVLRLREEEVDERDACRGGEQRGDRPLRDRLAGRAGADRIDE